MIPDENHIKKLWEKYRLPDNKRLHVRLVAQLAMFFAEHLLVSGVVGDLDKPLLLAAALLHDIDKAIPKLPGEQHPDAAVRVLQQEGMIEVADMVKTHPVHAILDLHIAPKTWEERILFLADKMVKYEILTVDKRFALWREEHLPADAVRLLDQCYPRVKALESDICLRIGVLPDAVANEVQVEYTSKRFNQGGT